MGELIVSTRAASLHQFSSKNKYPFSANISSCLRPETQILAILPTDRGRKCKRLQVKGVNLVALGTLAALMKRPERLQPLATHPGNFANRPKEEVQEIASKGGKASSGSFEPGSEKASEAGSKGGSAR